MIITSIKSINDILTQTAELVLPSTAFLYRGKLLEWYHTWVIEADCQTVNFHHEKELYNAKKMSFGFKKYESNT